MPHDQFAQYESLIIDEKIGILNCEASYVTIFEVEMLSAVVDEEIDGIFIYSFADLGAASS